MPDTSFEERARCYHCGEPGRLVNIETERDGSKHFLYTCETRSCRWYQTNWTFDTMPDGSIYVPKPRQKVFKDVPDLTEQIRANVDAEINRSIGQ